MIRLPTAERLEQQHIRFEVVEGSPAEQLHKVVREVPVREVTKFGILFLR
jgi:hypothetical protein